MDKHLAPAPSEGAPSSATPVNVSGMPSRNTISMPRKGAQSGDPYAQPIGIRSNVLNERMGANYGVQVGFEAHTEPSAGFTQHNGRIITPAVNRTAVNFQGGAQDLN